MHARLDELLSLRDDEPVAAQTATHVANCARCAASLARARSLRDVLQAMPPAPDPCTDGWSAVQARMAAARSSRVRRARLARAAAGLAIAALGLFAALRVAETPPRHGALPLEGRPQSSSVDPVVDLRSRSQRLDAMLASLPTRPAVARAATAVPIETLEAQVQWVDHQLSLAGTGAVAVDTRELWRDRVELMSSLVQLRYVEAQGATL